MNAIQELTRQRLLLQIEYNCERENFRRQTETFGIGRLAKRGDAWFPVRAGKSYFNSLNQLVIEIFRTADSEIEHNFEYGRPVQFFTIGEKDGKPHVEYKKYTGTISYVDGERMLVAVPDNAPVAELQHGENIGVQLSFDETSYRLMFEALDRVIKGKGNRLTYLRDLFYGNQKAETFSFPPIRFPWLNPAQEQAVNLVLRSKDVAIVQALQALARQPLSSRLSTKLFVEKIRYWYAPKAIWLSTGSANGLLTEASTCFALATRQR